MLKHAAEADEDTETKTDDALYCAACGQLLTLTRWALVMGEGREGLPVAVVCGWSLGESGPAACLVRPAQQDLFR